MVRYDARWRVEREMQKFVALAENSRAHKFTRDFHSTFPHSFLLVCNVLRLAKDRLSRKPRHTTSRHRSLAEEMVKQKKLKFSSRNKINKKKIFFAKKN